MPISGTQTGQNMQAKTASHSIGKRNSLATRLFFGLMFISIIFGWFQHEQFYLSAETGLGYYLGIVGGVCMLVLLLYPLRKKIRAMSCFGPIKYWFSIHMALGIIGPTLILYHANFSLGSVNSNVALFCMIVVAISGLIGRFIYTRIHFGLYGEKMTLAELKQDLENSRHQIDAQLLSLPEIQQELENILASVAKRRNFVIQILSIPVMAVNIYFRRKRIKRILKRDMKENKHKMSDNHIGMFKDTLRTIYNYVETSRRLGQLMTYERLFSLWHILHLPLFFMLVITGIIHVIAVHMY
jgi:chorismate mutase